MIISTLLSFKKNKSPLKDDLSHLCEIYWRNWKCPFHGYVIHLYISQIYKKEFFVKERTDLNISFHILIYRWS